MQTISNKELEEFMKRFLALLIGCAFIGSAAMVLAKDYQVTGPVVDVKDDAIVVKKGNENWEIAKDKDTKTNGDIKKGDKVMIKYKMTATSIEGPKSKSDAKAKTDDKKTEAKAKTEDKKSDAKPK
jgi:hypothetical protein